MTADIRLQERIGHVLVYLQIFENQPTPEDLFDAYRLLHRQFEDAILNVIRALDEALDGQGGAV